MELDFENYSTIESKGRNLLGLKCWKLQYFLCGKREFFVRNCSNDKIKINFYEYKLKWKYSFMPIDNSR